MSTTSHDSPVLFSKNRNLHSWMVLSSRVSAHIHRQCVALVVREAAVCTTQSTCATCVETRPRGSHLMDHGWVLPEHPRFILCLTLVHKPLFCCPHSVRQCDMGSQCTVCGMDTQWWCGTEAGNQCLGRCEGHGLNQMSLPLKWE